MNKSKIKSIVLSLCLLGGSAVNGWAVDKTEQPDGRQRAISASVQNLHSECVPCPTLTNIDDLETEERLRLQKFGTPYRHRIEVVESLRPRYWWGLVPPDVIREFLRLQIPEYSPTINQIDEILRFQNRTGRPPTHNEILFILSVAEVG